MTQLSQTIAASLAAALTSIRRWLQGPRRGERGSVTLENLLWAILIVALVGLATVALTNFINSKIGLLN